MPLTDTALRPAEPPVHRDLAGFDFGISPVDRKLITKAITQKFPGFTLPPDNFIEGAPAEILTTFGRQLLLG